MSKDSGKFAFSEIQKQAVRDFINQFKDGQKRPGPVDFVTGFGALSLIDVGQKKVFAKEISAIFDEFDKDEVLELKDAVFKEYRIEKEKKSLTSMFRGLLHKGAGAASAATSEASLSQTSMTSIGGLVQKAEADIKNYLQGKEVNFITKGTYQGCCNLGDNVGLIYFGDDGAMFCDTSQNEQKDWEPITLEEIKDKLGDRLYDDPAMMSVRPKAPMPRIPRKPKPVESLKSFGQEQSKQ